MEDESLKPNLLEQGTRWDHYNELRDLFASGAEILASLKTKSVGDRAKQEKLQHAVEMIEGRLNYITDFTQKTGWGSSVRSVVDGDVDSLYRKMKLERADDAKKIEESDDDSESPANYSNK